MGKNKRKVDNKNGISNPMKQMVSSAELNNSQKQKRDYETLGFMLGSFDLVERLPEQKEVNTIRKRSGKRMTGLKAKEKGMISSKDIEDNKKKKRSRRGDII